MYIYIYMYIHVSEVSICDIIYVHLCSCLC